MNWPKKNNKTHTFNQWITRYHGVIYRHALWMTGNQDIAKDMAQDAFFQAWLSMDSLKKGDQALAWLLTILRRVVYREQRYTYRHSETLSQLSQLDTELTESDAYPLLEIYSALGAISTNLREVFLLFHLHGFSYEEISVQLQIPKGTVMSRLSRARDALQKLENDQSNIIPFEKIRRVNQNDK
ncbi:MAG: RNA polymerase sigma factor [Thiohalomonadales bacterium]